MDTVAAFDAWKLLIEGFETIKRTMTHDMYQGQIKTWMLNVEEFIKEHGNAPETKQEVRKPLRLENVIVSGMVREADYDEDTDDVEGYETHKYSDTSLQSIVHKYMEAYNVSCTGIIDVLPELEVGMTFAVKVGNLAKGYLVVEELRFDK